MRKLKVAGLCVLALLVIAALGAVALSIYGSYALKAQIAAVREKGYPATPEEFDADIVPDEDNAALIYERIFESEDKELREQLEAVMYRISESRAGGTPEQWAEAQNIVAKCGPTVALLEEAVSKPRCRFKQTWSAWSPPFRNYARLRKLAQFCRARAAVKAHYGEMAEAVRSLQLGFGLWKSLEEDPSLIRYTTQGAFLLVSVDGLVSLLRNHDLTEAQARRLHETLSDIDNNISAKQAFVGEIPALQALVKEIRNEGLGSVESGSGGIPVRILGMVYSYVLASADLAIMIRHLLDEADHTELSYRQMKERGLLDSTPKAPFYAVMSRMSLGVNREFHKVRFRMESRLSAAKILLAIAAYKDIHGEYPESLDQLNSSPGWELPKDPYTGEGFGYRREGKGYVLQSTGPGGEDEKPGDYVWEIEH